MEWHNQPTVQHKFKYYKNKGEEEQASTIQKDKKSANHKGPQEQASSYKHG